MSRFCFFVFLGAQLVPLSLMAPPLLAQDITETPLSETLQLEREPLSPVASGIQTQSDGASVTLSWQPIPNQETANVILRHTAPITSSNYDQAQIIAEVPPSQTQFVDTPEVSGSYYYAVVQRDADTGSLSPVFVASENATVLAVAIAAKEEAVEERVIFFDVILKNQAVVITWETDPFGKSAIIYRSTQPFEDITALARATIVAAGADAVPPYVDYPVPGVPYYYAVLPESVVRSGTVAFRNGENTNDLPVEVLGEYAAAPSGAKASVRDIPLPRLKIPGTESPVPAAFSEKTEKAISDVESAIKQAASRNAGLKVRDTPFRFPEDTTGISGGEEAALKGILDAHFESERWQDLEADITRFLSLRRTDEVTARARFYLGEAYFFLENYSEALEEFLLAQKTYPSKAAEWIQKTLKRL